MRGKASERGFTMLDTMVAALVLIIGLVGLLSMQLTQVSAGLRARQISEATALLQQTLEELRLRPVPAAQLIGPAEQVDARGCPVPAGGPPACQTALLGSSSGTTYTRSWTLTPTQPGAAQVEVHVRWQDPQGQSHEVSFSHGR